MTYNKYPASLFAKGRLTRIGVAALLVSMAGLSVRPSGSIANGGAEAEDAFPWFGRLEGQRLDATEIAVGSRMLQANQTAAEPTSTYSPHVYHRGAAGSVSEGTLRLASPATPFPQAGGRLNCAGFGIVIEESMETYPG